MKHQKKFAIAWIILLCSGSILATNTTTNQEIDKKSNATQAQKSKLIHQGLAMGLQINLESNKNFNWGKMTKQGDEKAYKGVVVAESGRAYKAECMIETVNELSFCLPCKLEEITDQEEILK